MSERAEVEVLVPLDRPPTGGETRALARLAFAEARRLVADRGGRVLGLVSVARAESAFGELALRVRFAVIVPESAVERPMAVTVGWNHGGVS